MATIDFGFLKTDVEKQQQLARETLAEASKLSEHIETLDDTHADTKEALSTLRKKLLDLSDQLVDNAKTTSNAGIAVLTTLSNKSI